MMAVCREERGGLEVAPVGWEGRLRNMMAVVCREERGELEVAPVGWEGQLL